MFLSFISFALCGLIYFDLNSADICIARADYYFKKNDVASAVKLYEQAFEAGAKNEKAEYNYINLITNSPLNADAQEKLVKFIEANGKENAAGYKAQSFLNELRYEIHRKYPDNYISQGTYNHKIMRWSANPITYGYKNTDGVPEYFVKEIDEAFLTWEKALDGKITFRKSENNPDIILQFNSSDIKVEKDEKYIVALTQPILNIETLENMVTDYRIKDAAGNLFTENQIYNTALHEIGHTLGFMGHSDNYKNIMYMSTDTKTVSNDLRKSLTNSDINTMKLLYSIKPDITDKKTADGDYTKYLVLGDNTELTNAKIREAKTYINKAPNLPAGYIDLADAYVSIKEYNKAIKCLKKALTLAKDNETVYMINYNLALTSYFNLDYESARSYLMKSGPIEKSETAKHLLAEIYTATGKKSEAIGLYEDLISEAPSDIEYVISLTNIYVRDKEYQKARAVLKKFVSKNPEEKNNPRLAPYGIIKAFL